MRYAVIGAGALGLTLALRLSEHGHDVVVFERSPVPGGLASSFEVAPGIWLERFYHHLFTSDRHAIRLIEDVGLRDDLLWLRPQTSTLLGGRLRQLDSPLSLLRFDGLSPNARLRMGAALAMLRALPSPVAMHEVAASRWLSAAMGGEAYRRIWQPLLRGKFGADADEVAMAWFWARVHDRTAKLGYVRGGFHRLYERLERRTTERGASVILNAAVDRVDRAGSELSIAVNVGGRDTMVRFDRVVSTLPLRVTAGFVPTVADELLKRYPPPAALAAHCLVLGLERSLVPAYWVNVNDPGYPFLAVVEHTNLVPGEDYGHPAVVYVGRYCSMDDPLLRASAEEVLDAWLPAIVRLNPAFERSWIRAAWSFAAPFAQPIVRPGFRRTIPPFDTPLPGFYTASMFQVYPHDRGQNQSIRLAEQVARHLEE
jgi:protoporphyrinogen oxidase